MEAEPGTPCHHEHTEDRVEKCVHEHTADCYPEDGEADGTSTPSNADEVEPTECGHVCSKETGCVKKVLNCPHKHKVNGWPKEITLDGWVCEAFIQDENGNWPVEGEYTFAAALPEGYALDMDTKPLEIEVWYVNASTNKLSDYNSDDVAVINAMIENNGLEAKKAALKLSRHMYP